VLFRSVSKLDAFTLIELLIILAIIVVLASIGNISYQGYTDTINNASAISHINALSIVIDDYKSSNGQYPSNLTEINNETLLDPWGHPYQYLNIAEAKGRGKVRKDHNLVPLNTDYDLYSMGKDGRSVSPLTAKASRDDIVRANNGGFVGLGSSY